ncbi:unnamed protein product [Larinioides sclopetarius]|uniref:Uncharacterized protein n=1 Tax=Larinioides sclopetarius TaxID=280406 RepID=A0AAV2ABQ3_9ARAC
MKEKEIYRSKRKEDILELSDSTVEQFYVLLNRRDLTKKVLRRNTIPKQCSVSSSIVTSHAPSTKARDARMIFQWKKPSKT